MNFAYGGISFPLTSSLAQPLLQDADPALFVLLDFAATMIRTYVGGRLVAEAAQASCTAPVAAAVETTLPYEPGPFLMAEQIKLPALFIHRQRGTNDYHSITRSQETTTLECVYVLPALSPAQAERLLPIRWAVKAVLADRIERGQDDTYTPPVSGAVLGARVWPHAGIKEIKVTECSYGGMTGAGELYLPALTLTLVVKELHTPVSGTPIEGFDASIAIRAPDGTTTPDVATIDSNTNVPP